MYLLPKLKGVVMAEMADRAEMVIRLPRDIKTWVEKQAAQDASSQNSVLVRALRATMEAREKVAR
jgi:hypothetical protein